MVNACRVLVLGALTSAVGCGVGGDDVAPPSTPDPRLCTTEYTITGTFTLGMAPPDDVNNDTGAPPGDGKPDIMGCWPTGTWTWTVAAGDSTCATATAPAPSYSFRTDYVVTNGDPGYTYTLLAPQLSANYRLKVSSGGGGLCEGALEIFSDDGKETWNLQPALDVFNKNGPLTGVAEYAQWKDSQLP